MTPSIVGLILDREHAAKLKPDEFADTAHLANAVALLKADIGMKYALLVYDHGEWVPMFARTSGTLLDALRICLSQLDGLGQWTLAVDPDFSRRLQKILRAGAGHAIH